MDPFYSSPSNREKKHNMAYDFSNVNHPKMTNNREESKPLSPKFDARALSNIPLTPTFGLSPRSKQNRRMEEGYGVEISWDDDQSESEFKPNYGYKASAVHWVRQNKKKILIGFGVVAFFGVVSGTTSKKIQDNKHKAVTMSGIAKSAKTKSPKAPLTANLDGATKSGKSASLAALGTMAPTVSNSPTASAAPSNEPTESSAPSVSSAPSDVPTETSAPSGKPTPTPTESPTLSPSDVPTESSSPSFSVEPTPTPTESPNLPLVASTRTNSSNSTSPTETPTYVDSSFYSINVTVNATEVNEIEELNDDGFEINTTKTEEVKITESDDDTDEEQGDDDIIEVEIEELNDDGFETTYNTTETEEVKITESDDDMDGETNAVEEADIAETTDEGQGDDDIIEVEITEEEEVVNGTAANETAVEIETEEEGAECLRDGAQCDSEESCTQECCNGQLEDGTGWFECPDGSMFCGDHIVLEAKLCWMVN